jgi:hypothetical protein
MFIRFTITNRDFFIRKKFEQKDQIVTCINLTNTTIMSISTHVIAICVQINNFCNYHFNCVPWNYGKNDL